MKIFQIENSVCFYDATRVHQTLESTVGCYPPSVLFVEAPDYVFEGWGYLNGEFIQPTPPEGWQYDAGTGTFYKVPTTVEELRAAALERISGKCSAAIYAGVTVDGKHYTLSKNEQDALAIAQTKVDKGTMAVIYGDGLTDAATITAISAAAYEWGVVCTTYYAYLKQYIAAETDVDKLVAIDFGKTLPDSYMQQLAALLSSAGIDITKYASITNS